MKEWGFLFSENMKIEDIYKLFLQSPLISTDSREIKEGSIFFALKGQNFDGNKYAADALAKGATYAIVDNPEFANNPKIVLVEDTLKCLQNLANYHRRKLGVRLLAITGTNGKTTTKELISKVLSQSYKITFTKGNLNNHIGVPLTLLSIQPDTDIAVVEMGANHPGEIADLCKIAEPDFGLITNVGKAHLEGFGSFEGVIKTKSELYDFLRNNKGKCFLNLDNEILQKQSEGLEKLTYGRSKEADLYGVTEGSSVFLTIKALFPKGWLYLKSNLIGAYNFENILAAARVGLFFDIDPLKIQKAIENYSPKNNRSQFIRKGRSQIIMDAYNANPSSMIEALRNFEEMDSSFDKMVILGDMLELGEYSEAEHKKIVEFISEKNFKEIFLVGKCFSELVTDSKIKKFENSELLFKFLNQSKILDNKTILVKGSRGIRLERILDLV